jgi:hypothetical protein
MIAVAIPQVPVEAEIVEEVVSLKDGVMLDDPVVLLRQRPSSLAMSSEFRN